MSMRIRTLKRKKTQHQRMMKVAVMIIDKKCTWRGFSKSKMKTKKNLMMKKTMKKKKNMRMKNNPIEEGYKFFCLATYTGYVVNFAPNGQTAAKLENQEYNYSNEFGKIECMILHVL
eukprot:12983394-Ditylum_brightwellii.AAC.1